MIAEIKPGSAAATLLCYQLVWWPAEHPDKTAIILAKPMPQYMRQLM